MSNNTEGSDLQKVGLGIMKGGVGLMGCGCALMILAPIVIIIIFLLA